MFIVTKVFLTGEKVPNHQGRLIDGTIVKEYKCKNSAEVEALKEKIGTEVVVEFEPSPTVYYPRPVW
jgi:hypothetical protein